MALIFYLIPLLLLKVVNTQNETRTTLCHESLCSCTADPLGDIVDCVDKPPAFLKVLMEAAHYSYIDANNNNITTLYKIKTLRYTKVQLGSIDKIFPNSTLKILDLSGNMLWNITDRAFMNLQFMEELILSNNNLTILNPNVFKGQYSDGQDYPLKHLKTLHLDHNQLHTLDSDLFEHIDRSLENLYINNNPFTIIDISTHSAINTLVYMKVLDMSYTNISILPQYFMHTPGKLETLLLNGNNITRISDLGLAESQALKNLYLNENPIVNITAETGFPTVKTLEVLHMCRMPLLNTVSKHSLSKLESLEELHLSDNINLVKIDGEALIRRDPLSETPIVQSIKKLYIQNNKLTHLDLVLNWNLLTDLDISDNPWTCECENQWILDTLVPTLLTLHKDEEAKKLICAAPIEMEGKTMYELYEAKSLLRCLDLYGNRPERDGTLLVCLLLGLLMGITVVLFCMYSYKRHWFGIFDTSPASFSRQFYARTSASDADEFS